MLLTVHSQQLDYM